MHILKKSHFFIKKHAKSYCTSFFSYCTFFSIFSKKSYTFVLSTLRSQIRVIMTIIIHKNRLASIVVEKKSFYCFQSGHNIHFFFDQDRKKAYQDREVWKNTKKQYICWVNKKQIKLYVFCKYSITLFMWTYTLILRQQHDTILCVWQKYACFL